MIARSGFIFFAAACAAILAGCSFDSQPLATQNLGPTYTAAVHTVIAALTQSAPPPVVTPTPIPPTPLPPPADTVSPTAQPDPTATQTPAATTPPTLAPSPTNTLFPTAALTLLVKDDFEGDQGWYTSLGDDFGFEYTNGRYRIYNNLLGAIIWTIRDDNYDDIRLEVDVARAAGPLDGFFGVTCRYLDAKNYYALVIGEDGYFGILKMEKGEQSTLQKGTAAAGIILSNKQFNHLRADCIGETLTLYANGQKLAEVQNDDFSAGDVGLVAGNKIVEAGVDALFDNFIIYKP